MSAPLRGYQVSQGFQTPQNEPSAGGTGNGADWARIISGIASGAQSALSNPAQGGTKEQKRRNMASLLSQALRRELELFRAQQGQQGQAQDFANQAMQQSARGFTNSLSG